MKRVLLSAFAMLAVSGMAAADSVCVKTIMVVTTMPGLSFTCGNLTFSNFYLSNVSGNGTGALDINSVTLSDQGLVTLNQNPNLDAGGHEDLSFTVTGNLNGISLTVGGTSATVTERACANVVATSGGTAGLCANGPQSSAIAPLGQLTVHSLDPAQQVAPGLYTTGPVHIFQDISAGPDGLGMLYEGFGDPATVPEPVTLVLLGSALALVGLAGRRRLHRD